MIAMTRRPFSVAAPWALPHYIPLNGHHPLYRALFDDKPEHVSINSWDNVALYDHMRDSRVAVEILRQSVSRSQDASQSSQLDEVDAPFAEFFRPFEQVMTEALPGDIELHHTAAFPSMTRPFALHCEMFAPVLFPVYQQGGGWLENRVVLRERLRRLFGHPLCLGVFSHIPQTVETLGRFLADDALAAKIFPSRIGLSSLFFGIDPAVKKGQLEEPLFLFTNSAHQDSRSFFHRGGHVVLRFWQRWRNDGRPGKTIFRCRRPPDDRLQERGVSPDFVARETGNSIFWVEDYLHGYELNRLVAAAHFLLLPSASLHSVSIMQSLALGTVPVVTDTIGTDRYVRDGINGIILGGMREAIWRTDPETGIPIDTYTVNADLDDRLTTELYGRVSDLYLSESVYRSMQAAAIETYRSEFSGAAFSQDLMSHLERLFLTRAPDGRRTRSRAGTKALTGSLRTCLIEPVAIGRVFDGAPHPNLMRINSGLARVYEFGGAAVRVGATSAPGLHSWSPVSSFVDGASPRLEYAKSLSDLEGSYMTESGPLPVVRRHWLVQRVDLALTARPRARRLAVDVLGYFRRWVPILMPQVTSGKVHEDIELKEENVHDFNIIRCGSRYYGIPRSGGAFSLERVRANDYASQFSGRTVDSVRRQILRHVAKSVGRNAND